MFRKNKTESPKKSRKLLKTTIAVVGVAAAATGVFVFGKNRAGAR